MSAQRLAFKGAASVEEAEDLLSQLVSISSVNPFGRDEFTWPPYGEAKLAEFVGDFMRRIGCEVALQEVLPGRPNVIATMRGGGDKALLLEAHLDTVQVDNMTIEPFVPIVRDGRLFGRGACDTKGSLAAMMLAVKLVLDSGYTSRTTVHLAATADEEYKYRGVSRVIESWIRADTGIVGEPTNLDVVIAHKGCVRWRIITHGRSVHSSCPEEGINAIEKMADVIVGIRRRLGAQYASRKHPLVGYPTLSVGLISGGVGVNTVPDECSIHVDRRLLPGEKVDEVLGEIREALDALCQEDPSLDVIMEEPYLIDIPLEVSEDSLIVQCIARASRSILGNLRIRGVPYGTDASKIAAAGIPCVVFGPGSINDAHSAAESVKLWQVAKAAEILAQTIVDFGEE